jgi:hypothetical protein
MSREESLVRTAAVRDAMLDTSRVLVGLERPTDYQRSWGNADTLACLKIVASAAHTDRDVSELVAALTAAVKAS